MRMPETEVETLERRLHAAQAVIADLTTQRDEAREDARRRREDIEGYWKPWQAQTLPDLQRLRTQAALWHGKWAIVKMENNALRRALYARKTKET